MGSSDAMHGFPAIVMAQAYYWRKRTLVPLLTMPFLLSQDLVKTLQFHCSYFSFYKYYFEYRTRINDL